MAPASDTHGLPLAESAASPLMSRLAEGARRLLGSEDRRPLGGLSRSRQVGIAPSSDEVVVPLSSFQLVGLEEVRAKLADRWPSLAQKVHQIARNTIARHLVRGDVFDQNGDDGYLVLFASLGSAEAEFKSRIIAREITQHLLGEGDIGGIGLSALCTDISASALAAGDHQAVLAEALTRARPALNPPPGAGRQSPRMDPGLGDIAPARGGDAPPFGEDAQSPAGLRPRASDDARDAALPPQMHAYSPVWDVRQMTLLHFRAFALGAPIDGAGGGRSAEAEAFKLDLALLDTVSADLAALAGRGRRLPVTLAIHHSSLGSGSQRTELRRALAQMPSELRRLMTIEIGWPEGEFWTYSCKAFVEMIRPLTIGASALIALEDPRSIPPPGGWLRAVSTAVWGDAHTEAETLRLLTAFGARSRALGLDCAAFDVASRSLVLGAVGAGFRFLAGPAIHAETPSLSDALRFEPLDLYADLR